MIPAEPLKLTLSPDEMTLDDIAIFDSEGFSIPKFRKFLLSYGSWDDKQIGAIKLKELREVAEQVGNALKNLSVPKGNENNSNDGPTDNQVILPSGPST